jgi:hypothetical protein
MPEHPARQDAPADQFGVPAVLISNKPRGIPNPPLWAPTRQAKARLGAIPGRIAPESPPPRDDQPLARAGNGAQRRRVPAGGLTEGVASGRIC